MNIFKMYIDTEAGMSTPSATIKKVAKITHYACIGIGLLVFTVGLINFFIRPSFLQFVMLHVYPVMGKLTGWLVSLALRSWAVVVESHERNLRGGKRRSAAVEAEPVPAAPAAAEEQWVCIICGQTNSNHFRFCPNCGNAKHTA